MVGRSAVPASMLQRSRPSTPSRGATTTGRSAAAHTWARTAEGWSKSDRKAQPQSTECEIWPATGSGVHDHGASRTRRTMRCRADTIAQQHNNRNNEEYSTEPLRSLWLECRTIESNLRCAVMPRHGVCARHVAGDCMSVGVCACADATHWWGDAFVSTAVDTFCC